MSLDDHICRYYSLHGKAQSMIEVTGNVYAKECAECGGTLRHWKEDGEHWVCGHCPDSVPWEFEECAIPRGLIRHAPRPGDQERRLADLAPFGHALNQLLRDAYWRTPAQVMVGFALTTCGYAEIALHAIEYEWPSPSGHPWTEAMAEDWAERARIELTRRIRS